MYADDAQFLDADMPLNILDLKVRVEKNLEIANNWFTQNSLKINPLKTEMVIIKSRRLTTDPHFTVTFGNSSIKPSHSVKILGVTVDSHLSWEPHISVIVRRCYGLLIGLARMRYRLPTETKRLLVEALVFPHVRYCLAVWGGCTATQKRRVQKALNFGARIVHNIGYRERVTPVLRELKWLRVDDMVCERDVMLLRNILTADPAPEMLRECIVRRSDVSSRSTRASTDELLQLPRVRTEFSRRSFLSRAAGAWNGLPSEVRAAAADSNTTFKSVLSSYLANR